MDMVWMYAKVFLVGGAICAIGQALLLWTKLTSARILVGFVVAGVVLTALGLYAPLVEWAGAGATTPIVGFGYSLTRGVLEAIQEKGALGILTGGVAATAGGVAAAVFFGWLAAVVFQPKTKM